MKREDFLDSRGQFRTTSLFRETISHAAKEAGYTPIFTLREFEMNGLPSLHKMFMEDKDPTGYTTCMRTVGVWRYWCQLWRNKELKVHMDVWVEELEVRLVADAIKKLRAQKGVSAQQWLARRGWNTEVRAGRPTKEKVAGELKRDKELTKMLEDDANRIISLGKH